MLSQWKVILRSNYQETVLLRERKIHGNYLNTVETGYKNIVGSRIKCPYNRYVLIKGKINRGTYRNVSSENVLITGMFLYLVLLIPVSTLPYTRTCHVLVNTNTAKTK